MDSRKLIGKNISKIIKSIWLNNIIPVSKNTNIVIPKLKNKRKNIKSIWLNNIIPVSKNTNIVIPKLKNKRKNTIPKRFTTCGIVRLLLSLLSISVFTTSSLVFPSSSSGLADTRASTRSAPISSALLFPNCRSSHGCST